MASYSPESTTRYLLSMRLSRAVLGEDGEATDQTDDLAVSAKLAELIQQHQGSILEHTQSELVCALEDADAALETSRAAHRIAQQMAPSSTALRVGLLHATASPSDAQRWESAVESVCLLARRAISGQTLACMGPVDSDQANAFANICPIPAEDWHEDLCVNQSQMFQVLWQDEVPTRLMQKSAAAAPGTRVQQLRLRWRNKQLVLDASSPPVVMGRGGEADIVIESEYASRRHAELRYVHPCFVLADRSTNGTYVQIGESEFFLHQDELMLRDDGWISLGRRATSSMGKVVYFSSEHIQQDAKRTDDRI